MHASVVPLTMVQSSNSSPCSKQASALTTSYSTGSQKAAHSQVRLWKKSNFLPAGQSGARCSKFTSNTTGMRHCCPSSVVRLTKGPTDTASPAHHAQFTVLMQKHFSAMLRIPRHTWRSQQDLQARTAL